MDITQLRAFVAIAAEGNLTWLKFSSPAGTALEFRADSPNLQDTIPGIVYRDKAGKYQGQRGVTLPKI